MTRLHENGPSLNFTRVDTVAENIVSTMDPASSGFRATPGSPEMINHTIDILKWRDVPQEVALAAIDKAERNGELNPNVASVLRGQARANLRPVEDEAGDVRLVARGTTAEPSGFQKFLDTLVEILTLGFAGTQTYNNALSGEARDNARALGNVAATDPATRAEIQKAGGPEQFITGKLQDVQMDPEHRGAIIAEFVKGYRENLADVGR